MVKFSMSELAENAGNNTGNFLLDLADNVGNTVCGLYKDYAGNFLQGSQSVPSAFLKGTWDSLCAPRPPGLPPPATPPFSGGQCEGVVYNVKIRKISLSTGNVDGEPSFLVTGAVVGIKTEFNPSTGVTTTYLEAGGGGESPEIKVLDTSTSGVKHRYEYIHVIRVDGGADNCGDPPPDQPVVPIPPDRLNTGTPYTYNDGTDITIPTLIAPITPTGIVNVDVGGINFKFDAGGVEIETPGEEDEEKKEVTWVVVTLTTLPDKVMFGTPNVYFAGWITFDIEGDYTTREQINFERNIFRYPDRARGHHITFTNKANGVVTTYTTQE